jgi:hypothetical protein
MKDLIQKLAQTSDEVFAKICQVTAIDSQAKTADLKPLDGSAEVFDALLITDQGQGGFYLEPKVGSLVSVVFINNQLALVVSPSELSKMLLEIESTKMQIDKDGFLLKKDDEDLRSLMLDFIKAIKALKFTTNAGPTIKLINQTDFIELETRFKNLLKAN